MATQLIPGSNAITVSDTSVTIGASNLESKTIIGGTTTTSSLNLKSTSGAGVTGANINFLVGNNGATNAMTILNNGNVGIGNTSSGNKLSVVDSVVDVSTLLLKNTATAGYSAIQINDSSGNPK